MGFAMSSSPQRSGSSLGLWFVAVVAPIVYAAKTRTSVAMGITVSVLLGAVVQVLWSMFYSYGWVEYWVWSDFVLVPVRTSDPAFFHTLATAGFLHSQGDMMHVLGNVIILALVGVPLEQRLGSKRYGIVYVIGLLGGSLGWVAFNADSGNPALGASGAAFGLLGAYLAGWPRDEIPFPLLLIRPWPVVFIALLYFGLELVRALRPWMPVFPAASPTWLTSVGLWRLTLCCRWSLEVAPSNWACWTVGPAKVRPPLPNAGRSRRAWRTSRPLRTPGRRRAWRFPNTFVNR